MSKLLLIVLLITSNACAQLVPQDKLLHLGGSYVISSAVSSLVYNKTKNKKKSILIGLCTAVLAGGVKEIYDIRHGQPEWNDLAADVAGAVLGVVTIRIAI
tara:strand:- start:3181 stop:3483 length:303 start_codon:yes stop_codon:yes gene_type:complete